MATGERLKQQGEGRHPYFAAIQTLPNQVSVAQHETLPKIADRLADGVERAVRISLCASGTVISRGSAQ